MRILDIFYENIIKEAAEGRIDSFFLYNMIFATDIREENVRYKVSCEYDDLIIPTLNITNKNKFNKLLVEYVNMCLGFYDESNFPSEILNYQMYDSQRKISCEKTIIALLFANATIEDFNDPISFLDNRINFFKNSVECQYELGYSEILKASLEGEIKKDKLNNETPYQFILKGRTADDIDYTFPIVKFGISNNKAYVYAIQRPKSNGENKKINRALYKIGEGFNKEKDNYEIYKEGNLNDVTASFILVANVFVAYLNKIGINDIVVSSMLIERWNAKQIANQLRIKRKNLGEEESRELIDSQLKIQSNLTEKFLRSFLRLTYHYSNLQVKSYPMEQDSNLHIYNNGSVSCNNKLLQETSEMMMNAPIKSKKHR
jgi:hypothetical protein